VRAARAAIVGALVVAAAVWAAWPAPVREGLRFAQPESLDLEFPEGGIPANVVCTAGRVIANRPVNLVFRWLVDPVSIDVTAPQGAFALRLGPVATGAWLQSDGSALQLASEDGALQDLTPRDGLPSRVRLAYEDGAYRAQLDGRDAGTPIARPPPAGPAALLLRAGSSMAALDCGGAGGISRHVEGDQPPPGWQRTAWAGLVALVGWLCLGGWWTQLTRARPLGLLVRAAALFSAGALVLGLPLAFGQRNAARGAVPEACETGVFEQTEPRLVSPGEPWALTDRRDGDFRLSADVVLREGSVLDVLLRAGLPLVDRQLLATLSSDPALPSGVGRNLGTFLETEPAKRALMRLPADRPLRLEIECRDDRLEAWIDGQSLGAVRDLDLRAGRTALHALAGAAQVSNLRVEPLGQPRSLAGLLTVRALALGVGVLAALLLLAWPCRLRWGAALWVWPLAAFVAPMTPDAGLWFAACAALLLLVPLLVRAALAGRLLAALLAAAAGIALAGGSLWALLERPAEISPAILNRMRAYDVAGDPIPAAYAWTRHPLCRRFNPYLKAQQFRDRKYPVEKPAGVLRVVALGSSSTFGYGVGGQDAWAAQLERLLTQGGERVEVINSGIPGATAERLRYFLDGVVLPMKPDLVIVDLAFNDRSFGGGADERAHFRAMTTSGISRLVQLVERWSAARREQAVSEFLLALEQGRPVSAEDRERFSLVPARRFQDALRDMVSACRAAGAAIVLVQEPQRPSVDHTNLSDYHAAMAELGGELGVPVVALQGALEAASGPMFLDAVHPTPAGHAIIARTIAKVLYDAGLVGR
jgi:lysophospholipase L1-like esterase